MNYNDYDSNGNKKKINLNGFLFDKQKRAIIILVVYAIIIVGIILLIKTRSTNNQNKVNNETNTQVVENKEVENKEIEKKDDITFSLLDNNNYEFTFTITKNDEVLVIDGKRFDDKVYLTETHDGVVDEFSGLINEIKLKHTNYSYMNNYYIDILNNDIVKAIVNESNNNMITNSKISEIVNYHDELVNKDNTNSVVTTIKNNNLTGLEIDLSNFISDIEGNEIVETIKLEYKNYGLVDDFDV